jgi:histone-lysine N-methyltransferase SETMAR
VLIWYIQIGQPVNQAYYVEILKWLCQEVHRKWPELWPNNSILHHDNAPAHKALSVKQFLNQKSTTEMEHPPYSPHLALNDFWLFSK